MTADPEWVPTDPQAAQRLGLAIASLVLGILACVLSLVLVGALLGVIGIVLGLLHVLQKRGPNTMAWWGVGLCFLSLLASVGLGGVYYLYFQQVQQQSTSSAGGDVARWEGVLAPDITVTSLDGKTTKLSELKGKRVVFDFWATWCGPCAREIPNFVKLYNETSRNDLEIIGISNEDEATIRAFVAQKGMNYPVASAKNLPSPYQDVRYIPTTFFVDRKGVIRSVVIGYHDFSRLKELALANDFAGPPKQAPAGMTRTP